jgi:hypothetical protein
MDAWSALGAASGLSLASGLRAYLPLLALGLAARAHLVALPPPYTALERPWVLALLAALAALEFAADKAPWLNHLNDAVHTFIRPLAGAVAFAATPNPLGAGHPAPALAAGLLLALGVHATKATLVRPAVGVATLGLGTPLASAVEDVVVVALIAAALLVPLLTLAAAALLALVLLRLAARRRPAWY